VRWIGGGERSWGSTSDWHASWRRIEGAAAVGCGGRSQEAERGGRGAEWLWKWLGFWLSALYMAGTSHKPVIKNKC